LFYLFKAIQISIFAAWCYHFDIGSVGLLRDGMAPVAVGATLMIVGQALNLGVFYRLGTLGVFYGNCLGHDIPHCSEFPFSLFNHPQYIGALASIWGFFIVMRFPYHDWYLLPALETLYYSIGARLEG
jgi:phosphatidyl-N-methylethanolamine N-methyltransferase